MKKKIDIFWYWFLIIVAFVICFMFSSTKINAAISSGGSTENDNTNVVLPDDGIFEPCVSETGCNLTDEAIEQVNIYEQCHTYITTNIISNESLVEALNGKIYTTFTQEDCMEMINIASKREVIKNELNLCDFSPANQGQNGISTQINEDCSLNWSGLHNDNTNTWSNLTNSSINGLKLEDGTYTISISKKLSYDITFRFYDDSGTKNIKIGGNTLSKTFTVINMKNSAYYFYLGNLSNTISISENNFKIQIEKGTKATRYVSYDYHREYYEEGIDYADGRVNTNSTSYTQGVTDADNRVNTNSVNYKSGVNSGYEKATKDGKSLGTFIPNLLGGFGSFFLTLLNIDILGFNLLSIFGIAITIGIIILILKFMRG